MCPARKPMPHAAVTPPLPAQVLENMSIGGSLFDEDGAKIVPEIMARQLAHSAVLLVPEPRCPGSVGSVGELGFGSLAALRASVNHPRVAADGAAAGGAAGRLRQRRSRRAFGCPGQGQGED